MITTMIRMTTMVPRPMYMAWDSTPRSGRPHDLGPIKPDSLQLLIYRQFGHDAGQEHGYRGRARPEGDEVTVVRGHRSGGPKPDIDAEPSTSRVWGARVRSGRSGSAKGSTYRRARGDMCFGASLTARRISFGPSPGGQSRAETCWRRCQLSAFAHDLGRDCADRVPILGRLSSWPRTW